MAGMGIVNSLRRFFHQILVDTYNIRTVKNASSAKLEMLTIYAIPNVQ